MGILHPAPETVQGWQREPDDGPIVMLNLLRYRDRAEYPAEARAAACSGREAYQRYLALVEPMVVSGGGRVLWAAVATYTVIAPPGERWDDVLVVEYPSRRAFLEMVASPDYQPAAVHRTAGLEDSRLIATRPTRGLGSR